MLPQNKIKYIQTTKINWEKIFRTHSNLLSFCIVSDTFKIELNSLDKSTSSSHVSNIR